MPSDYLCHLDPTSEHRLNALMLADCAQDWVPVLRSCCPRLVSLLHEIGDGPIHQAAPKVQCIVQDVLDGGECGDVVGHDPHDTHRIARHALAAMTRLRQEWHRGGASGQSAVPPIMFG